MICQDIIHVASHGTKKMPKHVSLAMTMRHITGSKLVVTLLNRMGHSVSHDDIEVVDTSLAREVIAQSEHHGIIIPTNIVPGAFIQMAGNNNDFLEHTLDGKQTTHSTTLVMYQRRLFGPKPKKVQYADHNIRKRSLEMTDNAQHILECGVFGKRPSAKFSIDGIRQEWYQPNQPVQENQADMDLAWAIVRMCPTKLFTLDLISDPAMQQIPSWSAFNALICQANPCLTEVGSCPMIPGSPTEFSIVYTVMKQAQSMMNLLGQHETVITFDLAIYVKAK